MDEHSPPRRRLGRPRWQPTEEQREQAQALAGVGLPHEQIAAILKVDDKTLRKYLSEALHLGKALATAKVATTLFEKAVKDRDTASCIFWMKVQAGWSEKRDIGPDESVVIKGGLPDA